MELTLLILAIITLLILNTVGVVLTALQLPGNWLIVAATALFAWWRWDEPHWSYAGPALITLLILALLGELAEFLAGALGSKSVGGSKRGAVISVATALIGAILGSLFIHIPVVGTLIGAAIGAGLGAGAGDKWAGRSWQQTLRGIKGAAVGKLSGAAAKLLIAAAMWVVAVTALCF